MMTVRVVLKSGMGDDDCHGSFKSGIGDDDCHGSYKIRCGR